MEIKYSDDGKIKIEKYTPEDDAYKILCPNPNCNPYVKIEFILPCDVEREQYTKRINKKINSTYNNKGNKKITKGKWGFLITLIIIAVITLLLRTFIFGTYLIPSHSMDDTVHPGDFLIGNKLAYTQKKPTAGDIIIFTTDQTYIKRVIATEGDIVNIYDGHVVINGKVYNESYTKGETKIPLKDGAVTYPYKVPAGTVFVMGDNREVSRDSRYMGPIDVTKIEAQPVIRIWPFDQINTIN